jgi:hypothetical protein
MKTNRPSSVAKTLLPVFNSFLFFPVATNTWHSVQEVLSKDTSRLSLNGWFHADDSKASAAPKPEAPIQRLTPSLDITVGLIILFKFYFLAGRRQYFHQSELHYSIRTKVDQATVCS